MITPMLHAKNFKQIYANKKNCSMCSLAMILFVTSSTASKNIDKITNEKIEKKNTLHENAVARKYEYSFKTDFIALCVRVCKIPMHQCRQTIRIFLR